LVGFFAGHLLFIFSLIDLSAAVTVVEPCLYTYTLERCLYTGPSHHQNGCKSALEDADTWSGSIDRLRYTQELRAFKHERRISLRARWGGLDHLSHSETLFSVAFCQFWALFFKVHNTDMGGRLRRCTIHANRIWTRKLTVVGICDLRPTIGPEEAVSITGTCGISGTSCTGHAVSQAHPARDMRYLRHILHGTCGITAS
jgi:hypothetical protein